MSLIKKLTNKLNKNKASHRYSDKKPEIKEIPRFIPKKILVARRNCPNCKGTGEVSFDEEYCLCCKVKNTSSPKWSRRYWKQVEILTTKEIKLKVQTGDKDPQAIEVK